MKLLRKLNKKYLVILFASSIFVVTIYLLTSEYTFRTGFPLDDAWIHQTYARNLALQGEWSYVPDEQSAGSTSPLWTFLIAIGYFVDPSPYIWTFFLGWVLLFAFGILGYLAFVTITGQNNGWALGSGLFLILEWHLVWSAVSGMETLLFSFLVYLILVLIVIRWDRWIILGGLIGVSIWVRPDGITLLFPALLAIWFGKLSNKQKQKASLYCLIGVSSLVIPYLLFNKYIGDTWLPNTYFAKQAEYAIELMAPLWNRLLEQALLPLVGVGICLLPGFILFVLDKFKRRDWILLLPSIWVVGYLCLYAIRLPVVYQHGRYAIPMMPVYFFFSWIGAFEWIKLSSPVKYIRIISRAWFTATWLILITFLFLGARAYGRDVAIIESEMVATAHWIAKNTEPGALIAAHDIGALGYFGERRLLDMAGLISPEVIPFIRDEVKLVQYLSASGADYLVTFPGWYPELVQSAQYLYSTHGQYSILQGGENMVVYKWLLSP